MTALVGEGAPQPTRALDESRLGRLRRVAHRLVPNTDAVILYGSQARGTATSDSDIDVLILSDVSPGAYSSGKLNVTTYRPSALLEMARRGSLFVLHLKLDGIVISDPVGRFEECKLAYLRPSSYKNLYEQLATAASVLEPVSDSHLYISNLHRLGVYLLRTALYARSDELEAPDFDIDRLASSYGNRFISDVVESRRTSCPTMIEVERLRAAIEQIVGTVPSNPSSSVEGLALTLDESFSFAATLVRNVLTSEAASIDYGQLPPLVP